MPSRRSHSKSHHGCVQCKAQRVKCDESRPTCTRCERRSKNCQYNIVLGTASSASAKSSPSQHQTTSSSSPKIFDAFISFPSQSTLSEVHSSLQGGLPNQELELMHHYTTSTYLTLSNGTTQDNVWQHTVPQEALRHSFLMHGILAVSALHLAHLRPSSSQFYTDLAMYHYTSSLQHFRPILEDISPTNAVAAFIFSSLLACISFVIPQEPLETAAPSSTTPLESLQKMIAIFTLERGVQTVLEECWAWVINSSIEPLLVHIPSWPEQKLRDNEEDALSSLESRIKNEIASEELTAEALDSLRFLRAIHPRQALPVERMTFIIAWPVLLSPKLFAAICERKSFAIAIVAYYGVVLHELKHVWWVGDKGLRLVMACTDLLGPRWNDTMQWAKFRVDMSHNPSS